MFCAAIEYKLLPVAGSPHVSITKVYAFDTFQEQITFLDYVRTHVAKGDKRVSIKSDEPLSVSTVDQAKIRFDSVWAFIGGND